MTFTLHSSQFADMSSRSLTRSLTKIDSSYQRLSTGLRITRAGDDAAGLAIADSLNVESRTYSRGYKNGNDFISLFNVADGALSNLSNLVIRIRELAQQSANGTYSPAQRQGLESEVVALKTEYSRIISTTEFNGRKLFDGSFREESAQLGRSFLDQISLDIAGGLRNTWDGTFGAVNTSAAGGTARYGATADFDGDGNLDIVLALEGGADEIEVQFGDGNGGFGSSVTFNGPNQAYSVQTADLNGDGAQDFVAMPTLGGQVFAYINDNNGTGSFTLGSVTNWGADYEYGALGDVNGDGNIDIVASSGTDVALRLGNGDGTFAGQTSLASPGGPGFEVQLADVDQNGTLDLLYTIGGQVTVQSGGGNGTFAPPTTLAALGGNYNGLRVADMNSDGLNDIIVGSTNDFVGIYYGQGGGSFSAGSVFNSPNDIGQNNRGFIDVGDLDGDGNLDVIVTEKGNGTVGVLLNNGSGQLAYDQSVNIGSTNLSNTLFADLNNDGVSDILTSANGAIFSNISNSELQEEEFNNLGTVSVATPELARESMDYLDRALQALAKTRGTVGAYQKRIEAAIGGLAAQEQGAISAESTIRDADVSAEQSELVRLSIRINAATALLAQSQELRNRALEIIRDETIRSGV